MRNIKTAKSHKFLRSNIFLSETPYATLYYFFTSVDQVEVVCVRKMSTHHVSSNDYQLKKPLLCPLLSLCVIWHLSRPRQWSGSKTHDEKI